MHIRIATEVDLPQLLQFEQGIIHAERSFTRMLAPDPIYYYDIPALMQNPLVDFVVAEEQGKLVACGYARVEPMKSYYGTEPQGYLGFMYVVPERRGQGINALVMKELMRLLRQRGIKELCLEVYATNEPAIRAYEKLGFEKHFVEMRMRLDED
jgi:ribosomal protein S18 acetylase RimI-like enzyme